MIHRIAISDVKAHFSAIVRVVKETGRRVIVTRRGEEMVAIAPIRTISEPRHSRQSAFDEIERFRRSRGQSTSAENRADLAQDRM